MACDVYANGMEIACKAAAGKSIAATPDVCFTPPLTPATPPGVPIPYPNTGMASDTTDGSKTVMISGQEVMLKDKSTFKQSTGDEAGNAPKKGVVTSKIKGKLNFFAWSMNVKFEGENVPRHLDLMGHNEASQPPNTPPWPYTSKMTSPAPLSPCNPHNWILKPAAKQYTAQQKKDKLRASGIPGDIAEADAADHNGVSDGHDMSGKNAQSKLKQVCSICGTDGGDVDHVLRNETGQIMSIVEVKSGRCHIDTDQILRRMALANTTGASVTAKLTGRGAATGQNFIQNNPALAGVNVIVFP